MENPIKMDDLGGTIIFGNTHIWKSENKALSIPSSAKNSSAKSWSSMNQNQVSWDVCWFETNALSLIGLTVKPLNLCLSKLQVVWRHACGELAYVALQLIAGNKDLQAGNNLHPPANYN